MCGSQDEVCFPGTKLNGTGRVVGKCKARRTLEASTWSNGNTHHCEAAHGRHSQGRVAYRRHLARPHIDTDRATRRAQVCRDDSNDLSPPEQGITHSAGGTLTMSLPSGRQDRCDILR